MDLFNICDPHVDLCNIYDSQGIQPTQSYGSCKECEGCDKSVEELTDVVDEWAKQWELITDHPNEADWNLGASNAHLLFHRESTDIARRFYSLSDLIGVDDLFMEHALALTETYDKDFIARYPGYGAILRLCSGVFKRFDAP